VASVLESSEDIALSVDTRWIQRYGSRTEHPSNDAEKVTVENGRVTRIDRKIPEASAYGEFTGIAKFSIDGARRLCDHYHRCQKQYNGQVFRDARTFDKAYFIQLLQVMIEAGERLAHADTDGGYIEVDTQQDFDFARENWAPERRPV
jgi:choline kinase